MAVDSQFQVVHELTVGKSTYEACQRKERKNFYLAPDRHYFDDGSYVEMKRLVKNAMSEDCRNFYLWESRECSGCEYPKDREYEQRMRSME